MAFHDDAPCDFSRQCVLAQHIETICGITATQEYANLESRWRPRQDENEDWHSGQAQKNFYVNGPVEDSAYGSERPIGSPILFVNTTKNLTCAQAWVRKGVQKNGWTPFALRGKRSPVYFEFGMETVRTANVEEALSSWPPWNQTMVYFSQKNVVLCQGVVPWILEWEDARCLLTISNWMEVRAC